MPSHSKNELQADSGKVQRLKANVRIVLASKASLLLLFLGIVTGFAAAQQITADILGDVTDSTGAVVQNAAVTVQNLDTHATRSIQTSMKGEYVINALPFGPYSLTIKAKGFKTYAVPSLTLAAGDRARVNAQLQVGETVDTVTVEGVAPALQSDSSVLATVIDNKATQDLPLNGRDFIQQIQLAPGASEGPVNSGGLSSGGSLNDRRQTSSVSINGQSELLNNQMIDGTDNNERDIGTIGVRPSIDSIQEMRVQSNTYTAEVGRTAGGIVNVLTKSGTNAFRGGAFEFFRNDLLDTYPFAFGAKLSKSELRQNQYGFSLGGPIRKNHTFFFGDYEGFRLIQGLSPVQKSVPTLYEEQNIGDFTDRTGGLKVDAGALDVAGVDYFKLYPAPNAVDSTTGLKDIYIGADKKIQRSYAYDIRVDHQLTPSDQLFARFTYNNVYTDQNGVFPAAKVAGLTLYPDLGLGYSPDIAYNAQLNYTHLFSSSLLFEAKAAYTRVDNEDFHPTTGQNPNQAFGQPNINTTLGDMTGLAPVFVLTASNLGGAGLFNPVKDLDNVFQYQGSLTYTRGAHNIKIGAALIRRQLEPVQSRFGEGLWIFLDLPGLVQGQYVNTQRSIDLQQQYFRIWEPSGFIQDDWHVNHWLTLNIGVRYDMFTPFKDSKNRISNFDPKTATMLVAGQNGVSSTAGVKTDYIGLAPRVGFAASVNPTTVIRGGYGISYVPMNATSNAQMKNQPFTSAFGPCGFYNCGLGMFSAGLPKPVATPASPLTGSVNAAMDLGFRTSYVHQYNLTVQKDFAGNVATVSYVGLLGRHLAQVVTDLNAPPPNTCGSSNATCYNALRPFYTLNSNLTQVGYMTASGISAFNAFQASFERRLAKGLSANANYMWAHQLDDATGLSEEGAGGFGAVPSQIRKLDYGNADLDIRHRFVVTAAWEVPFGKNLHGPLAVAAKGWQINVINAWSTGQPFTVTNASNVSNTDPGSSNTDRPNQTGKSNEGTPSIAAFFNPGAFLAQSAGTLGSERRNQLYGPHYRHLDASAFKTISIGNDMNVEFRAELFNVANQANFGVPNASLGGSQFGAITSMAQAYAPRQCQFAMKLRF